MWGVEESKTLGTFRTEEGAVAQTFVFRSEGARCPPDSLRSTHGYSIKLEAKLKLPYVQHEALQRFYTSTESPSGFGSNSQIISYRVYPSTCIFHLLLLLIFFGIYRPSCK